MARLGGKLRVGEREVSFRRDGEPAGRPLVLLAHGAGAPLSSPFLAAVAAGLVTRGFAVARFHFPYMEEREATGRKRPPDREPVLLATWRAMIDRTKRWRSAGPLVLAGKSMGARMATLLLARGDAPEARAGVWFGYPLHPPGRKDRLRAEHLPGIRVPQLFVSGTRDPLADVDLLRTAIAPLGKRARLHLVPGGDHSLATSRKDPLGGAGDWLDAAAAFLRSALA